MSDSSASFAAWGEPGIANRIQVRLDGTRAEGLTFPVTNVGVIPPEVQQSLFDPFRGRQRGRNEGLGLGLYIVQQIVQAHQGRVEVESGAGRYTTFRVELPRRGTEVIKL